MFRVEQKGKGVALRFDDAFPEGGVGFPPGQRFRVHAQRLRHLGLDGGRRGPHDDARQVLHRPDRLLHAEEIAVAVFAEHDRLKSDFIEFFLKIGSQLAVVHGGVQVLLIFRGGDIRQIEHHERRHEPRQIRAGADGHFEAAALRALDHHHVAPEHRVGENMHLDLVAGFPGHNVPEHLERQRRVMPRRTRMRQPEPQPRSGVFRTSGRHLPPREHAGHGQRQRHDHQVKQTPFHRHTSMLVKRPPRTPAKRASESFARETPHQAIPQRGIFVTKARIAAPSRLRAPCGKRGEPLSLS